MKNGCECLAPGVQGRYLREVGLSWKYAEADRDLAM
jgi:hypothetical protein